jgi:hypothetical protein
MPTDFCKFVFREHVSLDFIEGMVTLAILKAERVFGRARTRLYASYTVARTPPRCVIDTSSAVGRFVAEGFVALALRLGGEEDFKVIRLKKWEP